MSAIVVAYIIFGIFGLFFDQVTNDLLALGVRGELVSIISKGIGAVVLGIGVVALVQGKTLPTLPPEREKLPESDHF